MSAKLYASLEKYECESRMWDSAEQVAHILLQHLPISDFVKKSANATQQAYWLIARGLDSEQLALKKRADGLASPMRFSQNLHLVDGEVEGRYQLEANAIRRWPLPQGQVDTSRLEFTTLDDVRWFIESIEQGSIKPQELK